MKTITINLVLGLCVLMASGVSQAALVSEDGGQLVYDTSLNITWLADANLAATDNFGTSGILTGGKMSWSTAQSWIAAMNAADYLGSTDWRLPTTAQPDATCSSQSNGVSYGTGCTGSEMGELFYNELGGAANTDILTTHNANLALFNNVNSDVYWSGTEYAPNYAWDFYFGNGSQLTNTEDSGLYAWAVRPGDAAGNLAVVPLPPAVWLFGSGLLGLVGTARRKHV